MSKKSEFEVVDIFSHLLGLKNKTDGSLFIYKPQNKGDSTKPDGLYYYDGITFILDAKAEGEKFIGQLEDYMRLENNPNYIGFKYNGIDFECYVQGRYIKEETQIRDKDYYKTVYFPNIRSNNENIISESAKKLANLFRDAKINKQMNIPFIGACLLCMKYRQEINLTSTDTILNSIKRNLNEIIKEEPITRKQKKEYIIQCLKEHTLQKSKTEDLYSILQEISNIHNFIHISMDDYQGHDIMNNFLKIFRKWNSVDANEKGEVFTPDHIAKLMYKITQCHKDNIILDPTCGSGTFLTNAMIDMYQETDDIHEKIKIKENRIIGIEIDDFNATIAGINMLLHGDGASNIWNDDCFKQLPRLKNCYDRVLMNPPFSLKDKELKFVLTALEYMSENGILSTILPKSCVKGTEADNIKYLEKIFQCCNVISVISLPNDLFYPNAGTATCILTLQKTNHPNAIETVLIDCHKDGFISANDTRTPEGEQWKKIESEILNCYQTLKLNEFRAIKKFLKYNDELLFEAYSSHRPMDIDITVFKRYLREYIASKIICGFPIQKKDLSNLTYNYEKVEYKRILITSILRKIEKGKEKSINRQLEDKYSAGTIPLIIAKKDNNGVGGMINHPLKIYNDKICIIAGGDGGGGKTFYCNFKFAATSFVMICDFTDEYKDLSLYCKFYISVLISERLFKTIAHGRTISDIPKGIEIKLPVTVSGDLNMTYIENFIKNLPYADLM